VCLFRWRLCVYVLLEPWNGCGWNLITVPSVPHPGNQWTWPNWQRCRTLENNLSGLNHTKLIIKAWWNMMKHVWGKIHFFWLLKKFQTELSYISLRPDTERAVFGLSGMPRKIKKVNVDYVWIGVSWIVVKAKEGGSLGPDVDWFVLSVCAWIIMDACSQDSRESGLIGTAWMT